MTIKYVSVLQNVEMASATEKQLYYSHFSVARDKNNCYSGTSYSGYPLIDHQKDIC